jgi:hypothetical protein
MSKGLYFSVIKEEPVNKTAKEEFEKRKKNKIINNKYGGGKEKEITITAISDDDINCENADDNIKKGLDLLLSAIKAGDSNKSEIAIYRNNIDKIYEKCGKNMDKNTVDSTSATLHEYNIAPLLPLGRSSNINIQPAVQTSMASAQSSQSSDLNKNNATITCDDKYLGPTILQKLRDIEINTNALKNGPTSKIMNFDTNQYETIDLEKEIYGAHKYITNAYEKCKPELYSYKKDIEGLLSTKPPLPPTGERQSCNFMSTYQSLLEALRQSDQKDIKDIKSRMRELHVIYETCNKTEEIKNLYATISKEYEITMLHYESQEDICNLKQLFNNVLTSINTDPINLRTLNSQNIQLKIEYKKCANKNEGTINIYNDIQKQVDYAFKYIDNYITQFTLKTKNIMLGLEAKQQLSIQIIGDLKKRIVDERIKFGLEIYPRNQDFFSSADNCIKKIRNRIEECDAALKEFISNMITMKDNNTLTSEIYNREIFKIENMYRNCQPVKNIYETYPFLKEYINAHKEFVEYFRNRATKQNYQPVKKNYQPAPSCNIL